MIDDAPGRSCPIGYRYAPARLATTVAVACDALYVVGGLYGNEPALDAVEALFERERGEARLAFNGDFHWFDTDPAVFERIDRRVQAFDAMRGNVETEIAAPAATPGADAGCGCGYPAWVGDDTVQRSNRILGRLRATASLLPERQQLLAGLPMWRRYRVGDARVAVVHGDAESLAGWGFAQEALDDPAHRRRVRRWFDEAAADVFASTHTCLPVLVSWSAPPGGVARHLVNNGAAGMPNFSGRREGLLTRIALRPFNGPERRFGVTHAGLYVDAIAVAYDADAWLRRFLRDWPEGSDAHASYAHRILHGPDYRPDRALRQAAKSTWLCSSVGG